MAIRYKAFWRDIPLGVIGFDIFDDYITSPPNHPRYGKLFNTENSVGAGYPYKICIISRLRRVAAFIATN